jgi:hypothetical protein
MNAKRFRILTVSCLFLLPGGSKGVRCFANFIERKFTKLSIPQLLISQKIVTAFGILEIYDF